MTQQWKLVPVAAPTPEMRDAFARVFHDNAQADTFGPAVVAMLEAAPTPPASAQDDAKDERQAFEAWAKKKKMPLARVGQQYDDFWVDHAWNGWQARASVAAPAAGDAREIDLDRVLSIADEHAEESREDGRRVLDRGGLLALAKDVLRAASQQQEG